MATLREYDDDVAALLPTHPDVATEIAGFRGLGAVLDWLQRRGIDLGRMEIVAQDEFSNDVLIPLGDGRWLAFGAT